MDSAKRVVMHRRVFLSASLMALASAACNLRLKGSVTPVLITATPDATSAPPQPTSIPMPDLAGIVGAIDGEQITLQAASGEATFALDGSAPIYGANGNLAGREEIVERTTIALWLDAVGRSVTAAQVLPRITGLGETPSAPDQPEPTGETREIGSLTMITRAGWGAAAPNMNTFDEHGVFDEEANPDGWLVYPPPLTDWLRTIVVHHTALAPLEGPRKIQQAHQGTKGYADIGYHYLIDTFGALYEGRSIEARGAHTGGFNTGSVGISLLGNYTIMPMLRRPLETLTTLIAWLQTEYGITHLAGHQDFQPDDTECPGEHLEAALPDIAGPLGLVLGTGGYVIPPWQE